MKLSSNRFVYEIMGCAMRVHEVLGCGFLEAVYGDALEVEFRTCGIPYVREDDIQVYYDGAPLKMRYRADFTCYGRQVIVELKAIRSISKVEWSQVLHYMKATEIPYALLVNFGRLSLQYDAFDADAMASVFGFICDTLAGPLEGYFDHPLFATGSQGVYNLFLDRAISGEEVLHVA